MCILQKNPTENDGNTQLGDHINCPTEGIFRLHPLESPDPEVRGQFKASHETPGPSRIPPVPGHSCVGSTDIETSVWVGNKKNNYIIPAPQTLPPPLSNDNTWPLQKIYEIYKNPSHVCKKMKYYSSRVSDFTSSIPRLKTAGMFCINCRPRLRKA